ncbi:MAG: TonB-dependent receptor [Xanthomonadaceae bacterium]|nr:TonB-dependent receptor [Xanthomonadaceae bacterium]
MNKRTSVPFVRVGWALTLGALTSIAHAQDETSITLEEVVVTATKTGETALQRTPMTISAMSGESIAEAGIGNVRDLAPFVPNLQVAENTGQAQVYIRGVGTNQVTAGADPSSTVHVDGIYIARPASYFLSFLDVDRIEVLRGPQGTLYGRNSVGGTINVISRKPDNDLQIGLRGEVGNYNRRQVEGYLSGPLAEDRVAASVSVMSSSRDAYRKNIVPGGKDIDDEDVLAGRAQLRFTPNDNVDVVLRGDWLQDDSTIIGFQKLLEPRGTSVDSVLGDFSRVALDAEQYSRRRIAGASIDATFYLSDHLQLRSLTGWRELDWDLAIDSDASDASLLQTIMTSQQDQISTELNLSGDFDRVRFVAGLYYFKEDDTQPIVVRSFVPGTESRAYPEVDTESWALFGQLTYDLTDSLSATLGLRYTEEDKHFAQNAGTYSIGTDTLAGSPVIYERVGRYTAATPKLGLEWRAAHNAFVYASATRGFKSGGFVSSSRNPEQGFSPEYLWSYEAGVKTDWLNNRLRVNAAAFYYDYDDLQVLFFLSPGVTDTRNAATASIYGLELEVQAIPLPDLNVGFTLGLLNAEYDDFASAPRRGNQSVFDASGQKLNAAPRLAFSGHAQYEWTLFSQWSLFVRGEASFKDQQFFTPENLDLESQDAYWLLQGSVGLRDAYGRWTLSAWGRNLLDEDYVTTTASFAAGRVAGRPGAPRTYGIGFSYRY